MKLGLYFLVAVVFLGCGAFGQKGNDNRDANAARQHEADQKTFAQNMKNAKEVSERQARDKAKEEMRDKTHDGRIKVSPSTSVGGTIEGKGKGGTVNVRTQTDRSPNSANSNHADHGASHNSGTSEKANGASNAGPQGSKAR